MGAGFIPPSLKRAVSRDGNRDAAAGTGNGNRERPPRRGSAERGCSNNGTASASRKTCPAKRPSRRAVPEGITRARFASCSSPVRAAAGTQRSGQRRGWAIPAPQTFSPLKPSTDNPPEEKSGIRANLKEEEGEEGCE